MKLVIELKACASPALPNAWELVARHSPIPKNDPHPPMFNVYPSRQSAVDQALWLLDRATEDDMRCIITIKA